MYVVVSDEELERLVRGESIYVLRRDGREGTVSIYDEDWCHVATGFLTRIGKLRVGRMLVELENRDEPVPVEEFCDDEAFLKRVLKAKSGGGAVYVHRLDPIKLRKGIGRLRWIGKLAVA